MTTQIPLTLPSRHHSPLGPSSFERVETCPASTLSEGKMLRSSSYADEGSVAHMVFEDSLVTGNQVWEWLGKIVTFDVYEIEVDMEMVEGVDAMVEHVRATYPDGFCVEAKLSMPDSKMFGYSDVYGVAADGIWTVMDLKYGSQFVPADSPQLGFYGIMGAIQAGIDLTKIEPDVVVMRTVILQPRLRDPIREHLWTAGALLALRQRLRDLEAMLDRGETPYKAGGHCRWCDRAATCPALMLIVKDAAMASLAYDPVNPPTKEQLDEAALYLPAIKVWQKAVEENLNAYLGNGGQLQNARLVKGRNSRSWVDEQAAIDLMAKYGVDAYLPAQMRSVAKAESALPKSARPEIVALTVNTSGKPGLALSDDLKSEAVESSLAGLENAALVTMASGLLAKGVKA
jgi:hypothetical protein